MVGNHLDLVSGALQVSAPSFKAIYNCKEHLVAGVVTYLGRGEFYCGKPRVNGFTVLLREDDAQREIRDISLDYCLEVWDKVL